MANDKAEMTQHIEHAASSNTSTDPNRSMAADLEVMEHDSEVPKGYWTSFDFIGSCAAIVLLANCLFIGYAMPVGLFFSITDNNTNAYNDFIDKHLERH